MTDKLCNGDRHPCPTDEFGIITQIATSASTDKSSEEEYDEVIINVTDLCDGGRQSLKHTEEVNNDEDWDEGVTFAETEAATVQDSNNTHASKTAAVNRVQMASETITLPLLSASEQP